VLLTVLTALVELDLARERAGGARLAETLRSTLRNTLVHPVVLPVLAGMVWNATGLGLPPVVDEVLELLGTAVVPLCVVLIGMSLAYYGVRGGVRDATLLTLFKLLLLPMLVLAVAYGAFGLRGLPLEVIVMMAALPVGSNALIFAQRYNALEAETTATIVFSTIGFALTAPLWLALLAWLR
jgi:malonate transporter